MDINDIGKRIKIIRTELLRLSQTELAEKLNTTQVLLSRLEAGRGGTIELVLNFMDHLNSLSLRGHFLFAENFHLELLKEDISINQEQIISLLKEQLNEQQKALNDVIMRIKTL